MSYSNGTPFLNLAQTIGTDHRDWFDENAAKLDLDTKMKTLWDGAASTADILSTLQENVANLQTDLTTLEGVVSGHTSTITTINESLVLINTALNALNTQVTNKFDSAGIADPYDASYGIYAVGDVVTYNGQRYVCNTAVTAAEPFDVSKWTAEDVQTVLDNIKSGLYKESIMVTANGTKTAATLLNELWTLADKTKISDTSYIELNRDGDRLIFEIGYDGENAARYGHFTTSQLESFNLGSSSTYIRIDFGAGGNVSYADKSQDALTTGWTIKLYY